ncbi:MAG: Lrp/AsnC family transcriptional regulator [Euryarchaeota archaeon]|nr:Lrp/AsnC family transcriptional regulator [Euryarchaeota archaeon]
MEKEILDAEYDSVISTYYGEEQVVAVVMVKVDTKVADRAAQEIADLEPVEDLFMVTGDTDLLIKARFGNYKELKHFVVNSLGRLEGIKETRTLMVVSTYKEKGVKKEA